METKPNPKRPYKMYAAVVAAVISYMLTQEVLELPSMAVLALNVVSIGIATYFVRNPRVIV